MSIFLRIALHLADWVVQKKTVLSQLSLMGISVHIKKPWSTPSVNRSPFSSTLEEPRVESFDMIT